MGPRRLIIAGQLPIRMRYQEWWPREIEAHLQDSFDQVIVLNKREAVDPDEAAGFSAVNAAIHHEQQQIAQYLFLDPGPDDTLLHCDLSFPGLFHQVLFHRRVGQSAVFCHASALNRYDIFQAVRADKWRSERTHANLYDKVLVATQYHADKLGLSNISVLGSLPAPPTDLLPPRSKEPRTILFASTSRPCIQKVDRAVEAEIRGQSGVGIHRKKFLTWRGYFQFLDRCRYLIVTSKEETYGYQITDAVMRGCIPIAPRAYSYPELLPPELLYDPGGDATTRAQQILQIAKAQEERPGISLVNDNAIVGFWTRLKEEMECPR